MIDAIDELVARSKDHSELRKFHVFHQQHPEVLDFLIEEARLRLASGFEAFSFHSLWQYARWKLELEKGPTDTYTMNDHLSPFYARAIVILYPGEFNGRVEFRRSLADEIFGLELEPILEPRPGDYARRLQWATGASLVAGWRPKHPHVITYQGKRRADVHPRETQARAS